MSIRNLSKDLAFYGLLDLLQRSLGIILVPIYTRVLSQTNYGDLDLLFTVCGVLLVVVDLQFVAGFSRFYLQHQESGNGAKFAGTILLIRISLGCAVAILFLSLGFSGLLEFKFIPSFLYNRTAWIILMLGIPVTLAYDILLLQTQMLRLKKWFLIGSVGNSLISIFLCVLFTVIFPWGIVGVALGQFFGKLVSTALLAFGLRQNIMLRFDRKSFNDLIHYTLPLVPGWWICFASAYVSRFFIYGGYGASKNAILSIAMKLAGALGLFSIAFRTAWQPLAMSYIGKEEGEVFYIRSLRLFIACGVFSVFCLTLFSRPILAILAPPSYGVAEYYIPFFLVGSIIAELDVNIQLGNQISKKTFWMSAGSLAAFLVNILILITLTVRLGIYAAGLGLLFSFIVKVFITYFSAQRNYKIHYDKRSFSVFCFGCSLLLILSIARSTHVVSEVVFFTTTAVAALFLPWFSLARSERQFIKDWVGQHTFPSFNR